MSSMEQAVLGACLVDPKAYWHVADIVSESDFADPEHRLIFRTIKEVLADGGESDAISVGEYLERKASAEFVRGPAYLVELAMNATPSNVRFYAERVASDSIRRQVKSAGHKIATLNTEDALSQAASLIAGISSHRESEAKPIRAYLKQAVNRMQERCNNPGIIKGVRTGIDGLDEKLGGLEDGTLNILAARPSMGKTAVAMQLAAHSARDSHTLVLSLEMTGEKLSERLISHLSGVSYNLIRHPHQMPEECWTPILHATGTAEKLHLTIDESGSHSIESIAARARQVHMQKKLRLLVVDHLGLINTPNKSNKAIELGDVTKALKQLAKALGCPVLLLVQLNRSLEQRADKRPVLADLRDSGRIEEDADTVMMLYRDEYYFPDTPDKGIAEIIIRKCRDGELGTIYTTANLGCMTFTECGKPEYSEADIDRFAHRSSRVAGFRPDRKTAASGG